MYFVGSVFVALRRKTTISLHFLILIMLLSRMICGQTQRQEKGKLNGNGFNTIINITF